VELTIDERGLGRTAKEINDALLKGNPTIRVRDYFAYVGVLELDVRTLFPEQEAVLVGRIKQELAP
jgi:L-seryl-tRNA(Ser) seleniumtransferase/D-glucosaminate-6-phosphate ammonia-lyase